MNPSVCANCLNEKPVNDTTNRLVTESCGHVKCMECLVQERDGCQACAREKEQNIIVEEAETPQDDSPPRNNHLSQDVTVEVPPLYVLEKLNDKKKKLETEHIKIDSG